MLSKYKIFLFVGFFPIIPIFAQQPFLVNFNFNKPELFNPAAWNQDRIESHSSYKNEFYLYNRLQFQKITDAPKIFGLQYGRLLDNNAIFGIGFNNESFGPLKVSNISGKYAYRIRLNFSSFISAGASINLNSSQYNSNKLSIRDQGDLIALNSSSSQAATLNPGVFFSVSGLNNLFNAGASYQNLIIYKTRENGFSPSKTLIIHSSFLRFHNSNFDKLSYSELAFVSRTLFKISSDFDISFKYQYKGLFNVRSGLHLPLVPKITVNSMHFDINVPINQFFKANRFMCHLGYAFELPFYSFLGISHEMNLSFLF